MNKIVRLFSFTLIIFFLSPFLILIFNLRTFILPELDELLWALKNSVLQSAFSLLICFVFGFVLVEGIFYLRRTVQNKFVLMLSEFLILLPSFLPALFSLLIFLSFVQPFPFGIIGVSLIHGVTYAGLFAVMAVTILNQKAKGIFEVSALFGAGKIRAYREAFLMLRNDFLSLSMLIFTICFTSFSIPIAVGGGRGTTLEILIYEKMHLSGNWSQALILSLIQSGLIAILSLFFIQKSTLQMSRSSPLRLLGHPSSAFLTLLYILFFIGGFLYFSVAGWEQVFAIPNLWNDVMQVLPATFLLGLASGLVTLVFFIFSVLSLFQNFLHRFFISFIAPSVSLLGLSLILLAPSSHNIELVLFLFSTVIIFFTGLYKMGYEQTLMRLKKQVEVAQLLGAGFLQILRQVIFPQVLPIALNLSGVAALWVVGDFALCKVIFTHDFLLAQLIESLMTSYRIEAATSLTSLLILIGLIVYLLFAGAAYVFNQESDKKVR